MVAAGGRTVVVAAGGHTVVVAAGGRTAVVGGRWQRFGFVPAWSGGFIKWGN